MGFEFGKTNYDSVSCFVYFLLRKMMRIGIRYGINNIRTLVGHKVSLEGIEKSPAVRF